jgi:nucleoside diphosphate kinase
MFTHRKIIAASLPVAFAFYRGYSTQKTSECSYWGKDETKNSAFVFIKPHANTTATQNLVKSTLTAKGLKIQAEGELTGEEIDKGMLIDQHYYAIASKATLLKPKDMPVLAAKFEDAFGVSWNQALGDGQVFNALDACQYLGVDASGLDSLWAKAKKVKFGGGFYCGLIAVPGKQPIYVFNGFFMAMRSKFVEPGTSIHYYVVDFSPSELQWADFRGKVLGPTDPKDAPTDSLRGKILIDWKDLGLQYPPNVGDNSVHASASPFEGLAEKMNWLKVLPERDSFGAKMMVAGISKDTIKAWSVDPQVKGKSLFDQLEDTDADECIRRSVELAK